MPLLAVIAVFTFLAVGLWFLSLVPGWAWWTAAALVFGVFVLAAISTYFDGLSNAADKRSKSEAVDREFLRRHGIVAPPLWLPQSLWSKKVRSQIDELRRDAL